MRFCFFIVLMMMSCADHAKLKSRQEGLRKAINKQVQNCLEAKEANRLVEKKVTLFFPETSECRWGKNGNGDQVLPVGDDFPNNYYIVAREETSDLIDFEVALERVCGLSIDTPNPSRNFSYDDEIFMTLGTQDAVVLRTMDYRGEEDRANLDDQGIEHFVWEDIIGLYVESDESSRLELNGFENNGFFCANAEGTQCIVPETERIGLFNIDLDLNFAIKVLNQQKVLNPSQTSMPIKIKVLGDDNDGDCMMSSLEFEVKYKHF